MTRAWKPGDVALVRNEYGVWNRAILQVQPDGNRWVFGVAYNAASMDVPARPLAAIDFEDSEQVERLVTLWTAQFDDVAAEPFEVNYMQAALREFASPKPPKPDEPTGLGAVVEDAEGEPWVRVTVENLTWPGECWQDRFGSGERWTEYADIDAVRVLSEGVQP